MWVTSRARNYLGGLLWTTNRLAEAEPLMLRQLQIFLRFTQEAGHEHPNLRAAIRNYVTLLEDRGVRREEIGERVRRLQAEFGLSLDFD